MEAIVPIYECVKLAARFSAKAAIPVLAVSTTSFHYGCQPLAFFLVIGRKEAMERPAFKVESFGKSHLVRCI